MPMKRKTGKPSAKAVSLLHEGFRAHHEKRYGDAIRTYKKALQLKPGDAEILNYLGVSYLEIGDVKKGMDALEKSLGCGRIGPRRRPISAIFSGRKNRFPRP